MGHIKLDRKILEWEWYSDLNTCRLFIHLLLKANWKDGRFQGIAVPRGSLVTSYQTLADESGLTLRSVRTAIDHLRMTGEVTVKRHAKFSVVTIKNYNLYQSADIVDDIDTVNPLTVKRHASDTGATTIEEKKEEKEEKKNTMCEAQDLFERLWKQYPNKRGKGAVSDAQKKRLLAIGEPTLVKAIERYSLELQKDADWRKPQNGSTFFNSGYVDYLDGNYEPGKEPGKKEEKKGQFQQFPQRNYGSQLQEMERQLLNRKGGET